MENAQLPTFYVKKMLLVAKQHNIFVDDIGNIANSRDKDYNHVKLSATDFSKLIFRTVKALRDEGMGLFKKRFPPGTFAISLHAVINLQALNELNERWAHFWNLVHTDFDYQLRYQEDTFRFCIQRCQSDTGKEKLTVIASLFLWQQLMSWLLDEPLVIRQIGFDFARDSESVLGLGELTLRYDQPYSYIEVDIEYLSRRHKQNEVTVVEFLKHTPANLFSASFQKVNYVLATKNLVVAHLRDNKRPPSAAWVAKGQNLSEQSLRRRLNLVNTNFNAIKAQVVGEQAVYMLQNEMTSVADIGRKLGFSEPCAFTRAFKNWSGQSPTEFRAQSARVVDEAIDNEGY